MTATGEGQPSTNAVALARLKRQAAATFSVIGPTELEGTVDVQGSKNAALKSIPTIAAFPGVVRLRNVPLIIDVLELLAIVEHLGAVVTWSAGHDEVVVDSRSMRNRPIPRDLTQRTAASFLFAGAMLARFGRVQIGRPGGDDLGPRPIGHHLAAFRALGASVCEGEDAVEVALASKPPLSTVDLVLPSSSGAVNVVLAAHRNCLTLRLRNAPIDADMTAFWRLLRRYGTAVRRDGPVILCECRPPERARPEPMVITCPPDRNDAFTWLAAGALTTKGLLVRHVHSRELASGIAVLRALGTTIEQSGRHALVVKRPPGGLVIATMTTIAAGSSPDFHSDWMPLLHLVLVTARGRACTVDRIYSNRIRQAVLLKSMGARIAIRGGDPPPGVDVYFSTPLDQARYVVEISGPARLKAVKCTVGNDIRAAAVAVLAATVAEGRSHIKNANALYRGYQDFASRLRALGTDIGSSPR